MSASVSPSSATQPRGFVGVDAAGAVRRARLSILAAILVSLLLHCLAGWTMRNRPIVRIDPSRLKPRNVAQRVRLVESTLPPSALTDWSNGADAAAPAPPDLEQLSKALLDPVSPPSESADPLPMLPVEDAGASLGEGPGGPDVSLSDVQMPLVVQQQLIGRLPLSVAFVPSPNGSDNNAAHADDQGTATGGAAPRTARQLLAEAGLHNVTPTPSASVVRPALIESAATDARVVEAPLAAPPIDFTQLALAGTTKLKVPLHLDNDFHYLLSVFRPRQGPGYFRVDITGRDSLIKLRAMPKDLVLLIDTSGSVPQPWVDAVTRGVMDALASLNQGDRFNIVLFKDTPAFFSAERIQPFNDQTLAAAHAFLKGAQSSGFTDVNHALSRLLVRDLDAQRVYYLILISDGRPTRGVMDTRELINRITLDNNLAASIYCVGVGAQQNQQLLDFLAYQNKGFCVFVNRANKAAAAIRGLVSRLRYPILKDVRLDVVGVPKDEAFPHNLPNTHQSEWFQVFGRFDQQRMGPLTMRVQGTNHGQAFDFTFRRDLRFAKEGPKQIGRDWAFQKLHHLYSEMMRVPDPASVRKNIEALRREFRLKTLY